MVCKYCNTQNADNAKFCSGCGKELVGVCCPKCGVKNPEGAIFCESCGEKLNGKRFCLQCGQELDDNMTFCPGCGVKCDKKRCCPNCGQELADDMMFCPSCGEKCETKAQSRFKNAPDVATNKGAKFQKAMKITSLGISIAIATAVIIFAIFIGSSLNSSAGDMSGAESYYGVYPLTFFDFFGNAWKYLGDISEAAGEYDVAIVALQYLQIIFGCLICVGTIIAVLVLGIKGIVRSTRAIKGERDSGISCALAAYLVYVGGATALVMLNAMSVGTKLAGESISVYVGFDTATTAGIAVGGVLVGLLGIAAILSHGKRQLNKEFIVKGSLSLGALVACAIFVGLCVMPFITLSENAYGVKAQAGTGYFSYMFQAARFVDANNRISALRPGTEVTGTTEAIFSIVLGLVAFLAACYVLIRMLCTISSSIEEVTSGNEKRANGSLGRSIEIFVMTCVVLGLTIGSFTLFVDNVIGELDESYWGFGPLIGLTVLAAINLGVEIARRIVRYKFGDESIYF